MTRRKVGHPQPAVIREGEAFLLFDQRTGAKVGGPFTTADDAKRYAREVLWPDYTFRWSSPNTYDEATGVATTVRVHLE